MRQPLRHLQSSAAPPLNTSRIWPASHDKPSLADIGHAFNESHGYSRSLSPDDGVENALASYIGGLAEAEREVEIAGWLGGKSLLVLEMVVRSGEGWDRGVELVCIGELFDGRLETGSQAVKRWFSVRGEA